MKQLIHKFFLVFLALGMLLICISFSVLAEEDVTIIDSGSCGYNVTYQLNSSGTLTISGSGSMYEYSYDTQPWISNKSIIKTVVVNEALLILGIMPSKVAVAS